MFHWEELSSWDTRGGLSGGHFEEDFLSGLDDIYSNVAKLAGFTENSFPCLVIGNKKDLVSKNELSQASAQLASWCNKCRENDSITFHIVSSKPSESSENDAFNAFATFLKNTAEMDLSKLRENAEPSTSSNTPVRLHMGRAEAYASSENTDAAGILNDNEAAEGKGKGGADVIEAKVVIAGAPAAGKTSILRRFAEKSTLDEAKLRNYDPTIGADFCMVQVPARDKILRMQIWDTSGDRKMISLGRSIYRNADYLILVYDMTDKESFQALDIYYQNFMMYGNAEDPDVLPCLLVGNKCDIGERATDLEEVLKWCTHKRPNRPITHIECSALRGIAVNDIFIIVADAIAAYEAYLDGEGTLTARIVTLHEETRMSILFSIK